MFFEISSNHERYTERYPIPFLLHSIGTRYPQEPIDRPRGFFCTELLWVTEGVMSFTCGTETRLLYPGEGVLMRPCAIRSYRAEGNEPLQTGFLSGVGLDGMLDYYGAGECEFLTVSPQLQREAEILSERCMTDSTVFSRSAMGYAWMVDAITAHFSPDISLTERVDQYLEQHFSEAITLGEIAAQTGRDVYALCRQYRAQAGCTVMERLSRVRVQKAKRYLAETSEPIGEIGRLCGYSQPGYFGARFRQAVGCSPREYRAAHQRKNSKI